MTADELRWNEQAATAAGAVLSDPVEPATRAEQMTTDMMAKQAGVGGGTRQIANGGVQLTRGLAKHIPGAGAAPGHLTIQDARLPGTVLPHVPPHQLRPSDANMN